MSLINISRAAVSMVGFIQRVVQTLSALPIVIVHGGVGETSESRIPGKVDGVKRAARAGYKSLMETQNRRCAVEAAINVLEDDPYFNAGKGSVLNDQCEVEMDAVIIDGKDLSAGSVAGIQHVAHPISVAKMVMEKTQHTIIGGEGLETFLEKNDVPRVDDDYLITEQAKKALHYYLEHGGDLSTEPDGFDTVGCVVVDECGHVAAGTSTGGLNGKMKGRVGDAPIPGAGAAADSEIGGVSVTGHGESIIRYCLSSRIMQFMAEGKSPQEAAERAIKGMKKKLANEAGAVVLSKKGEVGIYFIGPKMSWAIATDGHLYYGLCPGDCVEEPLDESADSC